MLLLASGVCLAWPVQFSRDFAPEQGLVTRYESSVRGELCLNGRWLFAATTDLSEAEPLPNANWDTVPIKIPSPWNVNGFEMQEGVQGGDFRCFPSYPARWDSVRAAWMEKRFSVPKEWDGMRTSLHFGAVAGELIVYVNGVRAGEGFDLFFPQEFDVTRLLHYGSPNLVCVKVIAPNVFDKPGPYGHREYVAGSFWGSTVAGIWQDVFLEARPNVSVDNVFVQPWVDRGHLVVQATVSNHGSKVEGLSLGGSIRKWANLAGASPVAAPEIRWKLANAGSLRLAPHHFSLEPGQSRQVTFDLEAAGKLELWAPGSPNLYGLVLTISCGARILDVKFERFGWRQFGFKGSQLTLNGKLLALNGDSWHFMGIPQMTRRYAWAWFKLLKDAGANAVRLHASVYPSFYHEMADEMGMIILDESAIWLSDGGSKLDSELYWSNCRRHIRNLVLRDRNHPSVFGWSLENEMLPVLRGVWHAPQPMIDRSLREVAGWAGICRTEDPTRPWLSGDGEWDVGGRLPVISIHYGGEDSLKQAAQSGKPWGVGETSMAYYGTPKQVAQFYSGAYSSDEARMKGLANESYGLLRDQQKWGAAYRSVFNIAWYSVQPLPLGKSDLTRRPSPSEGVEFGPYKEGVPGVQPERLGPYCTTLNPGYDPNLPLYRPWPMFDAIRAANLGIGFSPYSVTQTPTRAVSADAAAGLYKFNFLPENGSALVQEFARVGVGTAPLHAGGPAKRLLIDGSKVNSLDACQTTVRDVLGDGGTVWIWNVQPGSAGNVGKLIGEPIAAEPRSASSFLVQGNDPLTSGVTDEALYFSESADWRQMSFGLTGPFVAGAKVLLEACPADWRKWNYQAEPVKTAALFRSEHEQTGPRAVLVAKDIGKGRVILCNLSPSVESEPKFTLIASLLGNDHIEVKAPGLGGGFLDYGGRLRKGLVCGSFPAPPEPYSDRLELASVSDGLTENGKKWLVRSADRNGVFDFRNLSLDGPMENSYAYLAVWIKSPKPLNDLLSEPNLPGLSFTYGADDGDQIWLNGQRVANDARIGPLDPNMFKVAALPLRLGWNLLVVKVIQVGGDWKFAGRFECSDRSFLQALEFKSETPEDK